MGRRACQEKKRVGKDYHCDCDCFMIGVEFCTDVLTMLSKLNDCCMCLGVVVGVVVVDDVVVCLLLLCQVILL